MTSETNRLSPAGANLQAYALLTLAALGWGANAVLGRLAVGEVSPMALTSLRWLLAMLLLAMLARGELRRDWPVLRRHLLFVTAMGAIGFTVFNATFYVAAHSTTAVNIGIIQGSIPIFVLIGAFAIYRIKISALQGVGVAVTLLGVAIVAAGGNLARLAALAINQGDLLMVLASLTYAGYTLGLKRRPAVSTLSLLTLFSLAAFLASIPLAIGEAALGYLQWPTATGWLVVVAVALIPSVLSQLLFIQGVARIGPSRAGLFINLVPAFAAILAVVFLKEKFEIYHALALGLVLGGIWISERGKPS